jgi:O-antigen/teichoic acid export membrane protein
MIDYFKKFLVTYANQILRLLFIAGSNIIIARYLGPSGKGVLTLLMSFVMIVIMIGMVGVDEANVYFISSKRSSHRKVFGNAVYQTAFMSAICILLFLLVKTWLLSSPLKGITVQYFYTILVLIPFAFMNQHVRTILLGQRAIYQFNIFVILQVLLLFLMQIIFIPIYGLFGGVISIIIGTVVLTVLGMVFMFGYGRPGTTIDLKLLKKSYSFGVRSQLGIVFSYLNRRLDIFIVNYFLNPYQVGLYAIAVAVAELPWHLPAAAATVLFPWIADKKKEDAAKFTSYVLRNILFITTILVLILALLGKFVIVTLFGTAFEESVLLMYALLPGVLALGVTRILGSHFQGSGRPELGTLMVAFSFIETIVLDIILIPPMGALGAAIASSVAYITSALVGLFIFTKLWHVSIFDVLVPKWHEIVKIRDFFKILKRSKRNE